MRGDEEVITAIFERTYVEAPPRRVDREREGDRFAAVLVCALQNARPFWKQPIDVLLIHDQSIGAAQVIPGPDGEDGARAIFGRGADEPALARDAFTPVDVRIIHGHAAAPEVALAVEGFWTVGVRAALHTGGADALGVGSAAPAGSAGASGLTACFAGCGGGVH